MEKQRPNKETESPRRGLKTKRSSQGRKKKLLGLLKNKSKVVPTFQGSRISEDSQAITPLNTNNHYRNISNQEEDLQTPVTNIDSQTVLGSFSQQLVLTPQVSEGSLLKNGSTAKAPNSLPTIISATRILMRNKTKKSLRKNDTLNKSQRFVNGKAYKRQPQTPRIADINSTINEDEMSDSDKDNENHNLHHQGFDEMINSEEESESELNNSLEIPLGTIEPSFQDFNECRDILEYIDVRKILSYS